MLPGQPGCWVFCVKPLLHLSKNNILAQSEVDPTETPGAVEEPSKFLDHPIVRLIAGFFADLFIPPVVIVDEELISEVDDENFVREEPGLEELLFVEEPLGNDDSTKWEPESEIEPVIIPEEAVAAMHEDEKLGFGEIVKLMEIVQATCDESGENCGITIDSLLAEYEDGNGMGALFENYGKPEHLGVGQIQNENTYRVKNEEKTNNGKAKGKDK
jgi:hypothetical protein